MLDLLNRGIRVPTKRNNYVFQNMYKKLYRALDILENMLDSFSYFYIEIVYLNYTFCDV